MLHRVLYLSHFLICGALLLIALLSLLQTLSQVNWNSYGSLMVVVFQHYVPQDGHSLEYAKYMMCCLYYVEVQSDPL